MNTSTTSKIKTLHFITMKRVQRLWSSTFIPFFIISLFMVTMTATGQTGDLSQIRNGPASNPQKNFYSTFPNPEWVNGNAGASNAHYVEGMSIAYRSLITGVTSGNQYEYEIEYDTYHGAMAIDYLTHFQRLEPHGPFNHSAETVDPRIFKSGSREYLMTVSSTNTFLIPAPAPSGITTGSTKDISGQPTASYNALPEAEKKMTIYNGEITGIFYVNQDQIAISGNTNTSTRVRIRFTAASDSVVLAWGGHIASRLDWGNSTVTGKALSASGISGSPYHMRQKSMRTYPGLVNISSIGNQDRSLSADAVIPPPECPTVTSKSICVGSSSFSFSINNPVAGVTYTWSFGTNGVNAAFQNGTNTGNSVVIVPSGGGSFTSGGSFTLNILAVQNGIPQSCPNVATGTVTVLDVSATANPTTIDITSAAHNTTLTASIDATSTDQTATNYNYLWEIVTSGTAGTLTNAATSVATYTAGVADAGSTIQFKVTVTHKDDSNPNTEECSDIAFVSVNVSSVGACSVSPSNAVCQGTTVTHNGSPNPKPTNATYLWSLQGYGGTGTTTATLASTNGGVSMDVTANSSYRIVLTQTYANTALNTSCYQDVTVEPTPTVSTNYIAPLCNEKTFSVDVLSPNANYTYTIDQPGNCTTFGAPTALQNGNLRFSGLAAGDGFIVTVTTGGPGCTATSDCSGNPTPVVCPAITSIEANEKNNVVAEEAKSEVKEADTYRVVLGSPTKVLAAPNPYTEKIKFNLVSSVSGTGRLELFNILGQKVGTVYQGFVQAGKELTKEFVVPRDKRSSLIYVFTVGDQKITGKLINQQLK